MPSKPFQDRATTAARSGCLAFALVAAAVICGVVILTTVPPATHIALGIFLFLALCTVVLAIIGLGSSKHKTAITALVGTALAIAIFTPIAVSGYRDIPVKIALVEIERVIEPVCSRHGNPAAAEYIPGQADHHIVAVVPNGFHPVTIGWVYDEYFPTSLEDLDLVLCISDKVPVRLQTCSYTDGSTITRYQFTRSIKMVAARTGETVAEGTLEGDLPKPCPEGKSAGSSRDLEGSDPDSAEVNVWLEENLLP